MSDLAIQIERDRLRIEAQRGPCPTCGRVEDKEKEDTIRLYAAMNARLQARVADLETR